MARGVPIINDVIDTMVRMRGEGASIKQISEAVGIDARRVRERLKAAANKEAMKFPSSEELQNKREDGMTIADISSLYGISYYVVRRMTKPPQNKLRIPKVEIEVMRKRRLAGSSIRAISREFKRSPLLVKEACASIIKDNKKKKDSVKKDFISAVVNVAVHRAKTKLQVPDHVNRMKLSLMMTRGFSEEAAMAQAMNHYARGKVTAADDDYQPRKLVIRRRV